LKSWKLAFLKFRVLTIISLIPQDCELHQCMITAAKVASSLNVTEDLPCICEHQVQYCIPWGKGVNYLV